MEDEDGTSKDRPTEQWTTKVHHSDDEVAEYLEISTEELRRDLTQGSVHVIPLTNSVRGGDDEEAFHLVDVIKDRGTPSPFTEVGRAELRAELLQAIDQLSEQERLLIALYHHEELTLREISHVLDVSESRVRQLYAKAILKLRSKAILKPRRM